MLNDAPKSADALFAALADPSRRAMLDRLAWGQATVSELARPLSISLAAVVQHLQVLEASGLITTAKNGRVRTCRIEPDGMRAAELWISNRRRMWEERVDRLAQYLDENDSQSDNVDKDNRSDKEDKAWQRRR